MMDGVAVACRPPSNRVMLRPPPLHNVSNNARSFRTSSFTADLNVCSVRKGGIPNELFILFSLHLQHCIVQLGLVHTFFVRNVGFEKKLLK